MEPSRPRTRDEQQAWDLFAAAALAGAMPDGGQFGGVAERAAREADKLLELRRARLDADSQAAGQLDDDGTIGVRGDRGVP